MQKALDKREDQTILTNSLILLAECAFKNNAFEHNMRYFKHLQGTAIGTKFATLHAILFMGYFKDKILIDDDFMIWQHWEEKLREFFENT